MDRFRLFPSGELGMHPTGEWTSYADAQRALDAERARVKELQGAASTPINELLAELISCAGVFDVSTDYEDDRKALETATQAVLDHVATLQAQLESANVLIYKKNCALGRADTTITDLQAQLRQVEGERDRAEGALIRAGFRKDCDIAACNCGPQWGHGGHASQRLREIADALPYQNGGVLLERIESLVRENTTLRQLVAQLPVYKDVSISHRVDENDFETWKVWVDHNPLAECDTEGEASAIKGLLTYRATLVAGQVSTSIIGKQVPPSQWDKNAGVRGDIS